MVVHAPNIENQCKVNMRKGEKRSLSSICGTTATPPKTKELAIESSHGKARENLKSQD